MGAIALAPVAADVAAGAAQALPAKALIRGVPYVSWAEAAQWRYEGKHVINPSIPAAFKMIRRYWGGDGFTLFSFGSENFMPDHWKQAEPREPEVAKGLDDVKAWVARGVPVIVSLPLTPHAHPLPPAASLMLSAAESKGFKLPERGPTSRGLGRWASWQDQVRLRQSVLASDAPEASRRLLVKESLTIAMRVIVGYDDARRVMILHCPSFGPAWELDYDRFESNWRLDGLVYAARPPEDYEAFVAKREASEDYPAHTPDMRAATHYAYAYGYSEVGRAADAERELETGLAIPGVGKGYRHLLALDLSFHREAAGKIDEAIALAREVRDVLPESPLGYDVLNALYKKHPDHPGAAQARADAEQWKAAHTLQRTIDWLKAMPRDYFLPPLRTFRGWGCSEPALRRQRSLADECQ
jgi:tetratricopeptide (TPR) repeat protein